MCSLGYSRGAGGGSSSKRRLALPTQSSTVRTLAYLLYIYVDMWLQEDNIMAMAVHVRTILGCRNFHRLNLADQDSARRLVSELAAQVYACMKRPGVYPSS